jgi:hypothetical protein
MGIHASIVFLVKNFSSMMKSYLTGCAAMELQLPASCISTVNAG